MTYTVATDHFAALVHYPNLNATQMEEALANIQGFVAGFKAQLAEDYCLAPQVSWMLNKIDILTDDTMAVIDDLIETWGYNETMAQQDYFSGAAKAASLAIEEAFNAYNDNSCDAYALTKNAMKRVQDMADNAAPFRNQGERLADEVQGECRHINEERQMLSQAIHGGW